MLRVAVVYHILPHYREAVAAAMDASGAVAYTFHASGEADQGIPHADPRRLRRFVRAPFRRLGSVLWQGGAIRAAAARPRYDAIIYLGDTHFLSTWIGAALARARGVPVLFWAHGWLRRERGLKRAMRALYYRLADRMLVYAERGARLGAEQGYPAERITVVYNSLDVAQADAVVARIESGALASIRPREAFHDAARPLVICTARLTARCRFDLLIDAAARLEAQGRPINLLLVGDGPERASLAAHAAERGVDAVFTGACYDEAVLGQMIYHADLTVSPGKIGLTAIHSLMYGTPAITHGHLDAQMPEVEALREGTGALFRQGDAADLADAIAAWLAAGHDRAATRAACRAEVHARWNPANQARIIETAVLEVTGHAPA